MSSITEDREQLLRTAIRRSSEVVRRFRPLSRSEYVAATLSEQKAIIRAAYKELHKLGL